MSIVGAIIGNLSIVTTNNDATCSCKLAIMRPKDISPGFFAIYLKSFMDKIKSKNSREDMLRLVLF